MGSSRLRRRWLCGAAATALLAVSAVSSAQAPRRAAGEPAQQPGRTAPPSKPSSRKADVPKDFVLGASPWVDVALTSFWMSDRSSNFLNASVQAGGYFVERLRLSLRLTAPLDEANDEYGNDWDLLGPSVDAPSRSISLLYGASAGLILSSSRTFVFAPSITIWRADESDYGTTGAITLPFEWTTHRHLRVGFELALGHSFGGTVQTVCRAQPATSSTCRATSLTRPGGMAVLLQYSMGWALSAL